MGNEKKALDQNGLLALRSQLLKSSDKCSNFVHLEPGHAVCGEWPTKMPELMCEMLTWQWEELGDGNEPEFDQYKCPMVKKNEAKNGNDRKGHSLSWDLHDEF